MEEKLYKLADTYKWLEKVLDEAEEELPRDALDAIKVKIGDKAENIAKIVRSYEAESEAVEGEIDRLVKRSKTLLNKAGWLKGYLLQEMMVSGIERLKGNLFTISVRPCPPSVEVINEDEIPQEYRRVVPETWQPDKKAIIDHFKETTEAVPGTKIIKDKKTLQIR